MQTESLVMHLLPLLPAVWSGAPKHSYILLRLYIVDTGCGGYGLAWEIFNLSELSSGTAAAIVVSSFKTCARVPKQKFNYDTIPIKYTRPSSLKPLYLPLQVCSKGCLSTPERPSHAKADQSRITQRMSKVKNCVNAVHLLLHCLQLKHIVLFLTPVEGNEPAQSLTTERGSDL